MNRSLQQAWELEKAWADEYTDEIEDVVRSVAHNIITIAPSSFQRDTQEAIDYDIKISAAEMACRIRRAATCPQRDLTMTSYRLSGGKPEVEKVLEGNVRWYLYAWAEAGGFVDWMFVDLDVVRRAKLMQQALSRGQEVFLAHGDRFVYVRFRDLAAANAVVASQMASPAARLAS